MTIRVSDLLTHNTILKNDPSPTLGASLNTNNYQILNGGNPVTITGNSYPSTTGTAGQVLTTNGAGTLYFSNAASGSVTLVGDVTGSGSSPITTTIANSGVTAFTYGTASSVGTFTVNSKGIITSASNTNIVITPLQAGLSNVVNSLQVINGGGAPEIIEGSGIPSISALTGALYVDVINTGGNSIYRYDGSSWQVIAKNTTGGLSLYSENPGTYISPLALGQNSVAIGDNSLSTADESFAQGNGSNATVWGGRVYANGNFSNPGDAQHGVYVLRAQSTSASPVELYLDGATASRRLIIPTNSVVTFTIYVAARRTDASDGGAAYKFEGVIKKDSTAISTTFIGQPSKTVIGETNKPWDFTLNADSIYGGFLLTGIGESSKTIRWVATVLTTEVTN